MSKEIAETKLTISDNELANFVVCPEAWRLKAQGSSRLIITTHAEESKQLRRAWREEQALSFRLRKYAKVAYLLLVGLVLIIFLLEQKNLLLKKQQTPVSQIK